ncbi:MULTISPECIES: MarR family winged helix-turn-helix transcriptional regulator [Chryseobacterium]|uniref:DNA-binding MarR family transcriptional regulator n=1 Tax=Chryseobacterium camelliae TaxID=1265445 RepID=A0ABU0TKM6_9FLAO|nr:MULTISPECIES: MarR family winged helix-turn-helix transcriptional regulator [Chryseobacterium]MDT3408545.1 DNA-binding MarR family transcriptional regulator [Pseudacidovorax intermedius]MDQ1097600.1 DNA-binding MarR family transcriptional regulator [Chryseobacterium camelliae]MDQ1101529.1 DNA-binding MarR family transcriptional regulator [Chryseobacterium sp. SORGH_AS_1048]MDR6084972.1 DNA-binding MarR family transcriptional regulator [Chryseobacterium sp. SORGH_AS_0909]MDR6129325.1 DNA-bin
MENSPRITLLLSQFLTLYKNNLNALLARNDIDLTTEMSTVLAILWKKDKRKQQEIADILLRDKGGITKIINNLEKRGLVKRVADEADARTKIIALTDTGKDLEKQVDPLSRGLLEKALGNIDEEVLATTRYALNQMIQQLK